jgi:phosphoglycolate phosphatase-like HAD superfamily hydrolase
MSKLLLFDIDGTLILTGGAGVRALDRAFHSLFGVHDVMLGVPLAGRTDLAILMDAATRVFPGFEPPPGWLDLFRQHYFTALAEELLVDAPGKGVLPGVRPALDALARVPGMHLALLTGNFRKGAEVKLGYFSLWDEFAFGAFGDESVDRNSLLPIALEHARERGIGPLAPRDVFVIGDTPYDVACALSGGAVAVGVTTGPYDRAALEGAGADVVLPDLSDTGALVRVFGG